MGTDEQGIIKSSKIAHIGVAVFDFEKSIADYQKLVGFEKVERTLVTSENVRVAMLKIGDSELELLSPCSAEGAISKFLKNNGEGLHHIAVEVDDVSKAIQLAEVQGFTVIDRVPRKGAWGAEAAFVHPKSSHGVLLEYYAHKGR